MTAAETVVPGSEEFGTAVREFAAEFPSAVISSAVVLDLRGRGQGQLRESQCFVSSATERF